VNQAVTGGLLSLYYRPTLEEAHESVRDLLHAVQMGWFYRGLHVWGAHLLVAVMLLHVARTFAQGTFRRPREFVWVTGVFLLSALMASAFTGQALPMDEEGYQGLLVATSLSGEIPGVGSMLAGGGFVDAGTLTRAHGAHVAILPGVIVLLLGCHGLLVARLGLAPREGAQAPLFPKIILAVLGTLAILVTLTVVSPPNVGAASAGEAGNVKPSWFFLPLYQSLKVVPMWLEPWIPFLAIGALMAMPWMPRRWGTALFAAVAGGAVVLGIWGAVA